MPSETESLAVQLVRALFNSTGGRPHEWRMLEELDGATTDAIEFAAARGWVVVQGGHSIYLIDAGGRLVPRLDSRPPTRDTAICWGTPIRLSR
jgi:hypothetical protein